MRGLPRKRLIVASLLLIGAVVGFIIFRTYLVALIPIIGLAGYVVNFAVHGYFKKLSVVEMFELSASLIFGAQHRPWQDFPLELRYLTIKGPLVQGLLGHSHRSELKTVLGSDYRVVSTPALIKIEEISRHFSIDYYNRRPNGFQVFSTVFDQGEKKIVRTLKHDDNDAGDFTTYYEDEENIQKAESNYLTYLGDYRQIAVGFLPGMLHEHPIFVSSSFPLTYGGFSKEEFFRIVSRDFQWTHVDGIPVGHDKQKQTNEGIIYESKVPGEISLINATRFALGYSSHGSFYWRFARKEDFDVAGNGQFNLWHDNTLKLVEEEDKNPVLKTTYTSRPFWNYDDNISTWNRYLHYICDSNFPSNFSLIIADKNVRSDDECSFQMIPRILTSTAIIIHNQTKKERKIGDFRVSIQEFAGCKNCDRVDRNNEGQLLAGLKSAVDKRFVASGIIRPGETIVLPVSVNLEFDGPLFGYYENIVSQQLVSEPDKRSYFTNQTNMILHVSPFLDILAIEVDGNHYLCRLSISEALESYSGYYWQG